MTNILITGASGFIGTHLARCLSRTPEHKVRGCDIIPPKESDIFAEFICADLRDKLMARTACQDADYIFHLAADMGGIGYIGTKKAEIALNNIQIDSNMISAAIEFKPTRFFFSSSACVYPVTLQDTDKEICLTEGQARPYEPEEGYGEEKLFCERLCAYAREELGIKTVVARFHAVYGPGGCYQGGREKSISALCRKIALLKEGEKLEVWGDGKQRRSYIYINDCIEAVLDLVLKDIQGPTNVGTPVSVTIDELVYMIACAAKKTFAIEYLTDKPRGVRSRSSDNTKIQKDIGFVPKVSLKQGVIWTYNWVKEQIDKEGVAA